MFLILVHARNPTRNTFSGLNAYLIPHALHVFYYTLPAYNIIPNVFWTVRRKTSADRYENYVVPVDLPRNSVPLL